MNWLFIFIPIAVALERVRPEQHTWIFFAACIAIVPIARLIVEATEQISARTGDAVGAILANLLLALGVAFFLGGLRYHNQEYNPAVTRLYSTMMLTAVISMAVPSAFDRFFGAATAPREEQLVNLGIAFVLLMAYGLYLLFMLKTHPESFTSDSDASVHDEHAEID